MCSFDSGVLVKYIRKIHKSSKRNALRVLVGLLASKHLKHAGQCATGILGPEDQE